MTKEKAQQAVAALNRIDGILFIIERVDVAFNDAADICTNKDLYVKVMDVLEEEYQLRQKELEEL